MRDSGISVREVMRIQLLQILLELETYIISVLNEKIIPP
jgi:hypothetical protein